LQALTCLCCLALERAPNAGRIPEIVALQRRATSRSSGGGGDGFRKAAPLDGEWEDDARSCPASPTNNASNHSGGGFLRPPCRGDDLASPRTTLSANTLSPMVPSHRIVPTARVEPMPPGEASSPDRRKNMPGRADLVQRLAVRPGF